MGDLGDSKNGEKENKEKGINAKHLPKNTKWGVSGTLGKFTDKKIPIKIQTEWYKTEKENLKYGAEIELELKKESSSGAVHGIISTMLIRKNKSR